MEEDANTVTGKSEANNHFDDAHSENSQQDQMKDEEVLVPECVIEPKTKNAEREEKKLDVGKECKNPDAGDHEIEETLTIELFPPRKMDVENDTNSKPSCVEKILLPVYKEDDPKRLPAKKAFSLQKIVRLPGICGEVEEDGTHRKTCYISCVLTAILLPYLLAGAFLFRHLEQGHELANMERSFKWKNDTAILLATELRQVKAFEDTWAKKVFESLEAFERGLEGDSELGYSAPRGGGLRWDLGGALLFCLALLTLTGFGRMTPVAASSRMLSVFFCILGIPLMLLWLIYIGHMLAQLWLWLLQNICCKLRCPKLPLKLGKNSVAPTQDGEIKAANEEHASDHGLMERFGAILKTRMENLDRSVATAFAAMFLFIYFVFGSLFVSLVGGIAVHDGLYLNFLTFATYGGGCEIEIASGKWSYAMFWIFFHCLFSAFVNLCLMLLSKQRELAELETNPNPEP